ncbi:unnamed protein product [Gongylonema pulchrum]|uniref:Uncharacterized protein n=1 Tax=Gongylonema pulchrum TaxID=637853 RepID=A0A3P7QW22_9BILA|nr:unnamed protein product [Gongylonema pulchrum]
MRFFIFFRNFVETGEIAGVFEANNQEPLLLRWNTPARYYGCRLSETLASVKGGLSFDCPKFFIVYDVKTNFGSVAMFTGSNMADQLRAAVCLELVLCRGMIPTPTELDEVMEGLESAGWSVNKHRLVFDHWTYSEK